MVNSIENESGQRLILQILQILSEYEYIINIFKQIKGQESPIELLKGLDEQPESIQIEFLRWVNYSFIRIYLFSKSFTFSFHQLQQHQMDERCSSICKMISLRYLLIPYIIKHQQIKLNTKSLLFYIILYVLTLIFAYEESFSFFN